MMSPYDGGDPTPLQEAILGLLEEADLPVEFNDRVMRMIDLAERRKNGERDTGPTLAMALVALAPYANPSDDPDTGRGDAQRVIMRELGLLGAAW